MAGSRPPRWPPVWPPSAESTSARWPVPVTVAASSSATSKAVPAPAAAAVLWIVHGLPGDADAQTIAPPPRRNQVHRPHFYLKLSVDMGAAVEARKAINAQGVKVNFNDMVVERGLPALEAPGGQQRRMDTRTSARTTTCTSVSPWPWRMACSSPSCATPTASPSPKSERRSRITPARPGRRSSSPVIGKATPSPSPTSACSHRGLHRHHQSARCLHPRGGRHQ